MITDKSVDGFRCSHFVAHGERQVAARRVRIAERFRCEHAIAKLLLVFALQGAFQACAGPTEPLSSDASASDAPRATAHDAGRDAPVDSAVSSYDATSDSRIDGSSGPACNGEDEFALRETGDAVAQELSFTIARCCVGTIGPQSECRATYANVRHRGTEYVFRAEDVEQYLNTHHNWNDRFVAFRNDVELRWESSPHDGTARHSFVALFERAGGRPILPITRVAATTFE